MNVKINYSGGPLDGDVQEIESSPVADTPDIEWADYTISPTIALRPDEELETVISRGKYVFDHRDAENNLFYTWGS